MNILQIPKQLFDFSIQEYTESTLIEIGDNTNSVSVINVGTVLVTVNRYPLFPPLVPNTYGGVFAIGGNLGEVISRRQLDIGMPVAGGIVWVIQKYYLCK